MASSVTSIFNGQLQPTGTNTDGFNNADYAIIVTPTLTDDISIDTFLQLELANQNRLVPLTPVNILDNTQVTLIPPQFKLGNQFNLYLFIVPSEPINAEILVVNNTDDKLDEILEEVKGTQEEENEEVATDVLNDLTNIVRLLGGDVTAVLPLINSVGSGLSSLEGVDVPALPSNVDTISELQNFY
jgi:hypothetical protein